MKFKGNPNFEFAYRKAGRVLTNRQRILNLIAQLIDKLSTIQNSKKSINEARDKFLLLGRLLKAFAIGKYKAVPWSMIVGITATLIYFVNPADLVPDFIPVTGFVDDFTVLLWVYNSMKVEIDKFTQWEKGEVNLS